MRLHILHAWSPTAIAALWWRRVARQRRFDQHLGMVPFFPASFSCSLSVYFFQITVSLAFLGNGTSRSGVPQGRGRGAACHGIQKAHPHPAVTSPLDRCGTVQLGGLGCKVRPAMGTTTH